MTACDKNPLNAIATKKFKKYDFEHHYYHPALLEYLSTRKTAPNYDKTKKVLQVRDAVCASFGIPMNDPTRPIIDELQDFDEKRIKAMDKAGIDVALMGCSPAIEDLPREEAIKYAKISNDAVSNRRKDGKGLFIVRNVTRTKGLHVA